MDKKYAIGADVGGSHISAMLIDLEEKKAIGSSLVECAINNKGSAQEIIGRWSQTIAQVAAEVDAQSLLGIGFAMPGPFDYARGISLIKGVDKYENIYGTNIGRAIREELSWSDSIPFRYINDATAFAVGECWLGEAAAFERVVAITLGTGFGSSFIRGGVPVIEGDNIPTMGYFYDLPYGNSIADDYFATRWFVKEWAQRTGEQIKGVKELVEKAESDPRAKALFSDFGTALGDFIAPHLSLFAADCLVLGGNISGASSLFERSLQEALKNKGVHLPANVSKLGELAAMGGAARLLDENFWSKIKPLLTKY